MVIIFMWVTFFVMNVGLSATQERILKNGLGVILKPIGKNERKSN